MTRGHGIKNTRTGSIVLSRPDTTPDYWQSRLDYMNPRAIELHAHGFKKNHYAIVPVEFTSEGYVREAGTAADWQTECKDCYGTGRAGDVRKPCLYCKGTGKAPAL